MNADQLTQTLTDLGFPPVDAPTPAANYVPVVQTGNLLFVSGQVPLAADGSLIKGRLGEDASLEEGAHAAKICGVNILRQVIAHIATTGQSVSRMVKLGGFVNSTPDFGDHPKVVNGCSDLMVDVLGDAGRHARFALGVANLPFGVMVEIDAVVELR